jgi:hypothetical protein
MRRPLVFLLLSTLNFFLSLEGSSMMLLFQLCQNSPKHRKNGLRFHCDFEVIRKVWLNFIAGLEEAAT